VRRRIRSGRSPPVLVPFYDRFSQILAASGRLRRSGQTAREFAVDVEELVPGSLSRDGFDLIPRRVTDLYYAIRFGGCEPEANEIVEIERELDRFEASLRRGEASA